MVEWCKNVGLAAVLCLLTVVPNNVKAYDACYDNSCCDPCSLGGFEVGADFLYWKPCVDDLDFAAYRVDGQDPSATITTNTHSLHFKEVCLSWEPGVRVRVAMPEVWCDWKLSASWVWVHSRDTRGLTLADGETGYYLSNLLAAEYGSVRANYTVVDGEWDSTYQTWDALFSYDIACNRCNVITPFFGVEGLVLSQNLSATYLLNAETLLETAQTAYYKWTSDYFGVGLKIGTDYTYTLFDCMKVFARGSGSLVVGQDCASAKADVYWLNGTTTTREAGEYKDDDKCLIVPGYHLQVGFLYESCYCGVDFGVRLGYEFVNWYNVPNHRSFAGESELDTAITTSPTVRTYGAHGLLAGAEVRF